jgi:hypothetical protein
VVFIRAPAPALNPLTWTPEACRALKRKNPSAYRTDVLCEFADAVTSMFSLHEIEAATRRGPMVAPPVAGQHYVCAIDPATRNDAFALCIATRIPDERWGDRYSVAMVKSWDPPLSPDEVLGEIATLLRPYGINTFHTDQWSADMLIALAAHHGLIAEDMAWTGANKVDAFDGMKLLLADGRLDLPPDEELSADLRRVQKVVTQAGMKIEFPRTDGRHCDLAPAVALALSKSIAPPQVIETYPEGTRRKMVAAQKAAGKGKKEDWL